MAFGRKAAITASAAPVADSAPQRKSLIASALRFRFDDASYNSYRFRDEAWQKELWRLWRCTPELHFAASWVGQCCSRVRIYVADVDELGRVQGETKNKQIQSLSDKLLGGPTSKAEHLRMMGIDLTVSGECYIIGNPGDAVGPDKWYIVTPTEFRRVRGSNGEWDWAWGPKGNPMKIDLEKQVITRVWNPDPERIWCADSPARACSLILRELEQLTKLVAAEIDSRLVGNGLLIIPNDLDLPAEEGTTNNADSLMVRMATAGAQGLKGEGSALGVLPQIIEAPDPDRFRHLTLSTELSKTAHELRAECIERLGVGMDMPPEVLSGSGSENHWNGYLIEGQGIKTHIEPLMNRVCQALTEAYLYPALVLMGKDPSRYTYAFDTSPLVLRPQRLQDALNLYEKGIVSAQAVREAGFFRDTDKPDTEESASRLVTEVLLRDPQLFQNQAVRHAVGVPESVIPQLSMVAPTAQSIGLGPTGGGGGGSGPPPPMPPPTGIQSELPPPIPDTLGNVGAAPTQPGGPIGRPPDNSPPPTGLTASAMTTQQMGVVVLAEATVRRALELAGKQLLDKNNRNRWPDVPAHELHTRITVEDAARANRLLLRAWGQLAGLVAVVDEQFDVEPLERSLHKYCANLLVRGVAHQPPMLLTALINDGVIRGS
jgi:hypothetical protein